MTLCASVLSTALAAAFLFTVSEAVHSSLSKQRSTAFLSAGVSVDAQRKTHMGKEQLSLLQKTQSQMYSDIDDVQKVIEVALVEFGHWVHKGSANITNHTVIHSQQEAASSKEVHVNNSTTGHSSQEIPPSKVDPTKKANASATTRLHIPATEKATEKQDDPAINKPSDSTTPAASKQDRVRKIAKTQEAILESLFKHLKSNIVHLNKQEGAAKEAAAKSIQRLQARLKADKAELQKKDLSQFEHDRLVNRTRTDTFELQYWTRDRTLGHQMFHTNLKMEHGLMSRVHEVIAACKDAAAKGHIDPKLVGKLQSQALPKVFIQMRSNLKHQAQQYYAHVLTARWMVAEESEPE